MSNRIFIDTSILVEYRKGTKTELWEAILKKTEIIPCLNQAVVSEYLFYHLAIYSGKSPRTIKETGKIAEVLKKHDPFPFLNILEWLPDNNLHSKSAIAFMKSYNLLPNDALILASCKQNGINALASFDTDYKIACRDENISLLNTEEEFASYMSRVSKN